MDWVHDVVEAALQDSSHRYTRGQRRLVERLLAAGRPLTVRELTEGPGAPSKSAAYRNLEVLVACGSVRQIPSVGDDGVRYELHGVLTGRHHHLGCTGCGEFINFALPDEVERALALAAEEAERRVGFVTENHRLELTGTCNDCGQTHEPVAS